MHPIYQNPMKRLALSADDVKGIKHLYPLEEKSDKTFSNFDELS